MKNSFQIVYPASKNDENKIHHLFHTEAEEAKKTGIIVGTKPSYIVKKIMYRGFTIYDQKKYPKDERYINSYKEYVNCLYLSKYYPLIADLSIDTFFVNKLDEKTPALIKKIGWSKAFIKNDIMALEHIAEGKSVFPITPIEEIRTLYSKYRLVDQFAIRKYINPTLLKDETRYWVLNGNIYHKDNIVPNIVEEAAKRLNRLGSRYYTIDATPEMIIEVNPGESSDRHAENSVELFISWIKKEFYRK